MVAKGKTTPIESEKDEGMCHDDHVSSTQEAASESSNSEDDSSERLSSKSRSRSSEEDNKIKTAS